MQKYDLSLDTIPITVYSMEHEVRQSDEICAALCEAGLAVCVYPVTCADFGITCISKNNLDLREPHIPLAALSCFFKRVRGLPNISFNVVFQGKSYELAVNDKQYDFTVNVGKCKFLCAKILNFSDGVELSADVIKNGIPCMCTLCHDVDTFDAEGLSTLPTHLGMKRDAPAIAASYCDFLKIKCHGALPFYDAALVAISTLERHGITLPSGKGALTVNGREHAFSHYAGRLTFYPHVKYLS